MEQKFIITIGRQYGSGGREIGKRLSQLFNIAYYDKELIKEASKESGLNAEYFEKASEGHTRSTLPRSEERQAKAFCAAFLIIRLL